MWRQWIFVVFAYVTAAASYTSSSEKDEENRFFSDKKNITPSPSKDPSLDEPFAIGLYGYNSRLQPLPTPMIVSHELQFLGSRLSSLSAQCPSVASVKFEKLKPSVEFSPPLKVESPAPTTYRDSLHSSTPPRKNRRSIKELLKNPNFGLENVFVPDSPIFTANDKSKKRKLVLGLDDIIILDSPKYTQNQDSPKSSPMNRPISRQAFKGSKFGFGDSFPFDPLALIQPDTENQKFPNLTPKSPKNNIPRSPLESPTFDLDNYNSLDSPTELDSFDQTIDLNVTPKSKNTIFVLDSPKIVTQNLPIVIDHATTNTIRRRLFNENETPGTPERTSKLAGLLKRKPSPSLQAKTVYREGVESPSPPSLGERKI